MINLSAFNKNNLLTFRYNNTFIYNIYLYTLNSKIKCSITSVLSVMPILNKFEKLIIRKLY